MKRKLISAFLALALAFSVMPAAALADETSGDTGTSSEATTPLGTARSTPGSDPGTEGEGGTTPTPQVPTESSVAVYDGTYYDKLQSAIDAIEASTSPSGTVTLLKDVSGESLQIHPGADVTIDLAGCDLLCTAQLFSVMGTLTITDPTGSAAEVTGLIDVTSGATLNISAGSYSGGLTVEPGTGRCNISGGRFAASYSSGSNSLENDLASGYVLIEDGKDDRYPLAVVEAANSGTLISGVNWAVNDGTLTFSGDGAIYDYSSQILTPWAELRYGGITAVVLQEGITRIGDRSLASIGDWGSKTLTIPASVTEIGTFGLAFGSLTTLTFQGDAPAFAANMLEGQKVPLTILYPDGNDTWTGVINQNYGSTETVTWKAYTNTAGGGEETSTLAITPSRTSLTGGGTVTLTVSGVPQGSNVTVTCSPSVTVTAAGDGSYTYTADLPNQTATYTFTATCIGSDPSAPETATCLVSVRYKGSSNNDDDDRGSSSGSSSTTDTTKNPDGSTTTTRTDRDGTVTETTRYPDGTIETVVSKKDGSVTETVKNPDGSTETTVTSPNGSSTVTTVLVDGTSTEVTVDADDRVVADVTLTASWVNASSSDVVTLPLPALTVTGSTATTPTVSVAIPSGTVDPISLEVPVSNVTPGTVAVLVHPDGTEEVVKTSLPSENGVVLKVDGDVTIKVVDNGKTFTDTQNHWAADAIAFVTAREMFSGTTAETFSPNNSMTRAMLMTVLARFEGQDLSGGSTWYEKAMTWARDNGISDGSNPNRSISREQLAAMLYRYAGSPAVTTSLSGFTDSASVSGYATDAMSWAVENGLISGMGDGSLNPQGNATRAQVSTILMRFCENLPQ